MFKWNADKIIRTVEQVLEAEVSDGAQVILKDAQARCRRITKGQGNLEKSGRVVRWKKSGTFGAYIKFGGTKYMVNGVDTFYAHFVELGTPGTTYKVKRLKGAKRTPVKAYPFLRPALRAYRRKYRARLKAALS